MKLGFVNQGFKDGMASSKGPLSQLYLHLGHNLHVTPTSKSTQNSDAKRHVCYHTTDVITVTCNSTLFYSVTALGGMTVVYNDSHAYDHNHGM